MCIQRWLEQNRNLVNANSKLAALAPLSNHRKTFSKMPFHKPSDRFNQVGGIPSPKHEIRLFAGAFGAHGSCLLARRRRAAAAIRQRGRTARNAISMSRLTRNTYVLMPMPKPFDRDRALKSRLKVMFGQGARHRRRTASAAGFVHENRGVETASEAADASEVLWGVLVMTAFAGLPIPDDKPSLRERTPGSVGKSA
jgi:hypothetical protein